MRERRPSSPRWELSASALSAIATVIAMGCGSDGSATPANDGGASTGSSDTGSERTTSAGDGTTGSAPDASASDSTAPGSSDAGAVSGDAGGGGGDGGITGTPGRDASADAPAVDGSACPAPDSGPAACLDTGTDPTNCGACGNLCPPAQLSGGMALGQVVVTGGMLYWVDASGTLFQMPVAGGRPTTLATHVAAVNIAVDATSVYWTTLGTVLNNYKDSSLAKVPVGGGTPTVLASPLDDARGIAVDATSIYWAIGAGSIKGAGAIMKMGLDGGSPVALASGLNSPDQLAVDAQRVYWTNGGTQGPSGVTSDGASVMSVPLAGGTPTVLATGLTFPSAIAIDADSVYWANEDTIMKAPLGGGLTQVLACTSTFAAVAIAVDGAKLDWIGSDGLMSVPKDGGVPSVLVPGPKLAGHGTGLAVDVSGIYWGDTNVGIVTVGCTSGKCKTQCNDGDTRCDGINQLTCANGAFTSGQRCTSACVNGQCVTGACDYGQTQCNGANDIETCDTTGVWDASTFCTNGCADGGCVIPGECVALQNCCYSVSDSTLRMTCLNVAARGTASGCQSTLQSLCP